MQEWIEQRKKDWGDLPRGTMVSVDVGELQAFLLHCERYMALWREMKVVKGLPEKGIPTHQQMFGDS